MNYVTFYIDSYNYLTRYEKISEILSNHQCIIFWMGLVPYGMCSFVSEDEIEREREVQFPIHRTPGETEDETTSTLYQILYL